MSVPLIRKAVADDLQACARLVNDWMDETQWLKRSVNREELASHYTPDLLERRSLFVAEHEGEIIGYVSLDIARQNLRALYLAKAARGKGVGHQLLETAKAHCPQRIDLGVFERNQSARDFYEREGFRAVPEGYKPPEKNAEGIGEILLRWERVDV